MTRSLFDEVILDLINHDLKNLTITISALAKERGFETTDSDIRKLIEVSNMVSLENIDEEN